MNDNSYLTQPMYGFSCSGFVSSEAFTSRMKLNLGLVPL